MLFLAKYHHPESLLLHLFCLFFCFGDKWACCINDPNTLAANHLHLFVRYPMSSYQDNISFIHVFYRINNTDAFPLKGIDSLFVMDQWSIGEYPAAFFLGRFLSNLKGSLDTKAHSLFWRDYYFHALITLIFLPENKPSIRSTSVLCLGGLGVNSGLGSSLEPPLSSITLAAISSAALDTEGRNFNGNSRYLASNGIPGRYGVLGVA